MQQRNGTPYGRPIFISPFSTRIEISRLVQNLVAEDKLYISCDLFAVQWWSEKNASINIKFSCWWRLFITSNRCMSKYTDFEE